MGIFYIYRPVVTITEKSLKMWGEKSLESLVFWAGRRTQDGDYCVVTCYIPQQKRASNNVEVEQEAMRDLLSQLYLRRQDLIAEVHTHPPGIIHPSKIDRIRVSIHREGFIHIIVPNYCSALFRNLLQCSVYEYVIGGPLRALGADEIEERFIMDDLEVEI